MNRLPPRKSWPLTFSALSFLPFIGLFPKHCDGPGPGGPGGTGGSVSSAGEAGQPTSSAGASGETGAGGDAGSGAEPAGPDRVEEPLLGCVTGVSGKTTPGTFEVLPPPLDLPSPEYRWLTDWSGDGRTAVGYYTNEPFEDAYGAFFIRWRSGAGYDVEAKARIELSQYNETPTALVSCDGSVRAWVLGDGSFATTNDLQAQAQVGEVKVHQDLTLAEDGSTVTYLTGLPGFKTWSVWYSTKGSTLSGPLLDPPKSISWDGFTVFGISYCYYYECAPPKTYRWRPIEGTVDVTTTAPTPYVAADGQSIVFGYDTTHIGVWRDGAVETIDCAARCQPLAWSSRAQVLLVEREADFAIWTEPHGFRSLASLLTVPDGWTLLPGGLSLDGWTVTGTASSADTPFAYFRATLNANAFQ